MKVAILGCSGAMGSFFAKYFLESGHRVTGSDRRRSRTLPHGLKVVQSNLKAVAGADLVLVAVPMADTARVVGEVAPLLKEGCILVEISSVKKNILPEVKRALARKRATLLSLHPLFGPTAGTASFKVCVIGGRRDALVARRLFPAAQLVTLGARSHDRLMAYALSLVHLLNVAFASAVAKGVGIEEFEKTATPTGARQMSLAKAVLSQDPSLYSYIEVENPFVKEALSLAIEDLEGIRKEISKKDRAGFEGRFAGLAKRFKRRELEDALRSVYGS